MPFALQISSKPFSGQQIVLRGLLLDGLQHLELRRREALGLLAKRVQPRLELLAEDLELGPESAFACVQEME